MKGEAGSPILVRGAGGCEVLGAPSSKGVPMVVGRLRQCPECKAMKAFFYVEATGTACVDCGANAMSTPKRDKEKLPVLWIRRGGKLVRACGGCSPCRRGRYSKCEAPQSAELVYAGQRRDFSSPVMTQEEAARITRERLGIEGPEDGAVVDDQ